LRAFNKAFVDRAARYLFKPGLSVVPEAMLALDYRVSAMHDPTEGGVSMGVYELADASGKSVELLVDDIPVLPETRAICTMFNLDPLGLLGSGALLATFRPKDAEAYILRLESLGIRAEVIGRMIPGKNRSKAISKNGAKPLSFSERDEVLKVFQA
jgi:hydrogenase maturation factor